MKTKSLIKYLSHVFLVLSLVFALAIPVTLPASIANAETAKPAQVKS